MGYTRDTSFTHPRPCVSGHLQPDVVPSSPVRPATKRTVSLGNSRSGGGWFRALVALGCAIERPDSQAPLDQNARRRCWRPHCSRQRRDGCSTYRTRLPGLEAGCQCRRGAVSPYCPPSGARSAGELSPRASSDPTQRLQSCTDRPSNRLKSRTFAVTSTSSLTRAMAAICPSAAEGGRPRRPRRARSRACQVADSSS